MSRPGSDAVRRTRLAAIVVFAGTARRQPRARLAALMALTGALAFLVLGTTPAALDREDIADSPWTLAPPAAPDLAAAQAALAAAPLWASQPAAAPAADATPPPPPPPRLLGIIRVGAPRAVTVQGVFLLPDGRRERAAVGAKLGDGSTVEALAATRASLRMADGRDVDLRLLDGPAAAQ